MDVILNHTLIMIASRGRQRDLIFSDCGQRRITNDDGSTLMPLDAVSFVTQRSPSKE